MPVEEEEGELVDAIDDDGGVFTFVGGGVDEPNDASAIADGGGVDDPDADVLVGGGLFDGLGVDDAVWVGDDSPCK